VRPHEILLGTTLLAFSLGGCAHAPPADVDGSAAADVERPADESGTREHPVVAVVRTTSLQWEGEQTYIPLYADGTASGLIVVNFDGGRLYGTGVPDAWTWTHPDTVEICASVRILRNESGFPPIERDCGSHPITGKELDQDEDGEVDLVETFTVLDPRFYQRRPGRSE